MKKRHWLIFVILAIALLTINVFAEDGQLFRRDVSKTPDAETEKAAIYMMDFYVPAQAATGELTPVANYCLDEGLDDPWNDDGTCAGTDAYDARDYAKPLISVYIDDIGAEAATPEGMDSIQGGISFGTFDAFVAVSLDDGTTWRNENLSRSQDLSSFTLANGHPYPGDVHNVVHQVAEDKVLAVWASKYCQSGFPLYSLSTPDNIATYSDYLADLEGSYGKNAMYLYDLFGVGGAQGSVNYTEQGFPEIGEIPYSCIWTARGKLLPGDDPMTPDFAEASHVVWTAPERLTSGVRDANLPAVDCAGGAGCALTWQEDPEGLRPGKGLGPGEGWSGAIANAKTDIWYSYITFADFDLVFPDGTDTENLPADGPVLIEDYEAAMGTEMDRPKPYVPMAIPVRLTDNDMCKASTGTNGSPEDPFCWIDFDSIDDWDYSNIITNLDGLTGPEEGADFCTTYEPWTNPGGTTLSICVTEDGRWMIGRVASTRVRMALKPYSPVDAVDMDGDGTVEKSAWLSLAAEETKALGITVEESEEYDPVDIGKDVFYYSFDFAKPYNLHMNTTLDADDPSPYVVQQGGMLNQPAKCSPYFITTDQTHPDISCPGPGEFYDTEFDPITGYEYYLTEIARRFALTSNNIANITDPALDGSGLASMLIYKQGIIWQGGPADIMLRRVVVQPFCTDTDGDGVVDNTDDCFDKTVDNPFAYENMECVNPDGTDGWVYPEDNTGQFPVNPYYLKGLCTAPAINISGSTAVSCDGADTNDGCAALFPVADDGTIPDSDGDFPKVREWRQLPYAGTSADDTFTGDPNDDNDLDDQSWENPFDVAKGHRGFLYGDMVLMMYAWSPNWKSNTVGNDHYNLYQRRSFDGGLTWTTYPDGEGVQALEYYYTETTGEFEDMLWTYAPGANEQARNLSLLTGNKVTVLDPRYSPPGGLKQYATIRTDWLDNNADLINFTSEDVLPYDDDAAIDPSKYYLVYETGDNTTVAEGEAIPLNLYYSRATDYGDTLEWFDYVNDPDDCDPDPITGEVDWETCVEPRWPWLENADDDLSGEASVVMNPGGTFVYNVWNQWKEEILPDGHELVYDSDMWYRRLLYLPDDTTLEVDPVASILYVNRTILSLAENDTLILVGSAKGFGADGDIEETVWLLKPLGSAAAPVVIGTDKVLEIQAQELVNKPGFAGQPGWAQITFMAKDKGGRWSSGAEVPVWIVDELHQAYMPFVMR
ncbi:MAG: hypothetical protein H6659_10535 [Ardenticatenaceae bacterium]|nr:hypothetical protein [Ardenticatenaceae bacterium]MCB8987504.1 hypothetical protein [Ardenticatenaceae bacterium]